MYRVSFCSIAIFVALSVTPVAAGTFVGNMDAGSALVRVEWVKNPDGTYTSWIDINPNTYVLSVGGLVLTIQGDLYQSFVSDPTAIAVNGGSPNVNYFSQSLAADILDNQYDAAHDTYIYDELWAIIFETDLTPDDGTQEMHFAAWSRTLSTYNLIDGTEFFHVAQVTTNDRELTLFGEVQLFDSPDYNPYFVSLTLPEPTTLAPAALALMGVVCCRWRRT